MAEVTAGLYVHLMVDLEALLDRLDLEERVRLLTGATFWVLHPLPSIGLRSLGLSDGPCGVRGVTWDERDPSLNLPSATALAATWDPDLAYRYGEAMAAEARRKEIDVILGPTINLHRSPLGGRHFEAFSEDPFLTGVLAVAWIKGCQAHGVAACPKHYVANDFETERYTASVELSERALRELYLAPFEAAVVDGGAWTVMSAYNAVRGVTMTESDLLRDPLCETWGFDGVVISDWTAVRSLAAARARQDLVMPGPTGPWGEALVEAVRAGEVDEADVAEKVRRVLRLATRVGGFDPPAADATVAEIDPAGIALAREAEAAGAVLAANDGILPLAGARRVVVIGDHAARPRTQGGGSAMVMTAATVSPLDGLRAALPDATVTYRLGTQVDAELQPLDPDTLTDPTTGERGVHVDLLDAAGNVVASETRQRTSLVWLGTLPAGVARVVLSADYRPTAKGAAEVGVRGVGRSRLTVDDRVVLDGEPVLTGKDMAAAFLDPPSLSAPVEWEAGATYRLRLDHDTSDGGVPLTCALTLGWRPLLDDADALIAEAVREATMADVAVVVVGTTEKVESEGFDRTSLSLPGRQDELVEAVAAANPRTVVVVNAGSPVLLPWRQRVAAVLLTWFGGQEYGHALADVLTGAVEPGGRLPTTWPAAQEDVPVIDVTPRDGVLRYDEGIHLGYRAWLRARTAPAYPFGWGLGYTTWEYSDASVSVVPDDEGGGLQVAATVRNTGTRPGREVVQVYLSRPESAVERPVRWLGGFASVSAEPGPPSVVSVRVPRRALEHWDEQAGGWRLEPGTWMVTVARHAGEAAADTALTRAVEVAG